MKKRGPHLSNNYHVSLPITTPPNVHVIRRVGYIKTLNKQTGSELLSDKIVILTSTMGTVLRNTIKYTPCSILCTPNLTRILLLLHRQITMDLPSVLQTSDMCNGF